MLGEAAVTALTAMYVKCLNQWQESRRRSATPRQEKSWPSGNEGLCQIRGTSSALTKKQQA
jgi:hypothetical protein